MKKVLKYLTAMVLSFGLCLFASFVFYSFFYAKTYTNLFFALGVFFVALCFSALYFYEHKTHRSFLKLIKHILIWCYSGVCLYCLLFAVCIGTSGSVKTDEGFSIKTDFFSNQNVMVIVPHQDDDILLAGGLLTQYVENGSQVSVVFTTQGDLDDVGVIRINEAKQVLSDLGINKENIYFLGFGNQYQEKDFDGQTVKHLYNSPDGDALWTSVKNHTKTDDIIGQDSYIQCEFTRNNFLYSIKALIEEKRPDVIYAVDYDAHFAHKAACLMFDEAMGIILKEDDDYNPTVYKGFAYGTAWTATDDYMNSFNLSSSKKPNARVWKNSASGYVWEERVRVPIDVANTNRMIRNTPIYNALKGYESQFASENTGRVLRSDKVFWERRTDSLLYQAVFYADGKESGKLNDFKIKDSNDVIANVPPNDAVQVADSIEVILPAEITMDSIGLYDNADTSHNVLGGYIVFDDGSRVDFGEINGEGSLSLVEFEEKTVKAFTVHITKKEGELAGFTELEAYSCKNEEQKKIEYIMPVDEDGNFAYNYWLEGKDTETFTIYSYPSTEIMDAEKLEIICDEAQKKLLCFGERRADCSVPCRGNDKDQINIWRCVYRILCRKSQYMEKIIHGSHEIL